MDQGLDELIEWLLTEIGFSGLNGFSALDLVKAVRSFHDRSNVGEDGDSAREDGNVEGKDVADSSTAPPIDDFEIQPADATHASIVWKWLVSRRDVIVVPAHLKTMSFEEVLAASQAPSTTSGPSPGSSNISHRGTTGGTTPDASASVPRLYLSEDRQWKAIAGHGPDLKRVPRFEWDALVAIASTKERGIMQGDLVRLTGQDKRSLPTRTDALARKGYIIKQPVMLRGCKTSKIWLIQFSKNAKADVERQGLPPEVMAISVDELTESWDPVSFSHYYTGSKLDYLAISQTFLLILRAYKAMRYCDLRTKMNIQNLVPQMRALAKSSRWWSRVGVIRFEPMQSRNSNKLFRDCMKFVRDPTPEEWENYRTTPKANLIIPTTRVRKNKKGARAPPAHAVDPTSLASRRMGKKNMRARPTPSLPSPSLIRLSSWTFYKPMANIIFDIIKRAGSEGSTNVDIGVFTLGWPYRKWISTLTTLIGLPRTPPIHLQAYAVYSYLHRVGKTNTYKFVVRHPTGVEQKDCDTPSQDDQVPSDKDPGQDKDATPTTYSFPEMSLTLFVKPGSRVTGFLQKSGAREAREIHTQDAIDVSSQVINEMPELDVEVATEESAAVDPEPVPTRPPGVYCGKKNSLDPFKSPGRPRKSIVVIFSSPALKDPTFFTHRQPATGAAANNTDAQEPLSPSTINDNANPHAVAAPEGVKEQHDMTDLIIRPDGDIREETPRRGGRSRGRGAGRHTKSYECENCGRSWKNPNGLEYHQKKSQTACNPEWVAKPIKPPVAIKSKRKRGPAIQQKTTADTADNVDPEVESAPKPQPEPHGNVLPSKRPKLAVPEISYPTQQGNSDSRPLSHHPVRLHNILELPSLTNSREITKSSVLSAPVRERSSSSARDEMGDGSTNATANKAINIKSLEMSSKGKHIPPVPSTNGQPITNMEGTTTATLPLPVTRDDSSQTSQKPSVTNVRRGSNVPARYISKAQREANQRTERTIAIITELLDQNSHVYPGDSSLYQSITTRWTKGGDSGDIAPPEWKRFQTILKRMQADKLIKQDHFSLLTGSTLKTISVVYRPHLEDTTEEVITRRVNEVKNKIIELYPKPYLPSEPLESRISAGVPLHSPEEIDNREDTNAGAVAANASELTTLPYEVQCPSVDHVTVPGAAARKRTYAYLDTDDSDDTRIRTPRKRLKSRNSIASGRRSSQKINWHDPGSSPLWTIERPFLQDPDTGEWSMQRMTQIVIESDQEPASPPTRERAAKLLARRRIHRGRVVITEPTLRSRLHRGIKSAALTWRNATAPTDMVSAMDSSSSIRFLAPANPESIARDEAVEEDSSEQEADEEDENLTQLNGSVDIHEPNQADSKPAFAPITTINAIEDGVWPDKFPSAFFMNRPGGSFTMAGNLPDDRWFLRENLPQDAREMADTVPMRQEDARLGVGRYGKFGRDVAGIEAWEGSRAAIHLLSRGTIAPDYIFISLGLEPDLAKMEPMVAEWQDHAQYSVDNIPDDIKYASSEDDKSVPPVAEVSIPIPARARKRRRGESDYSRPLVKRTDGNWKHRTVLPIPKRGPNGRWHKSRAVGDHLSRGKETELMVAIVIVRKLIGGVDKVTDWGLILKIFPTWSLSGIKKFWARLNRERANYIDALSKKFDCSFLEAYEKGEIAPINYDDLENYNWKALIAWAAKLQTHDGVELPLTRKQFDSEFELSETKRDEENWRENWLHFQTSSFLRMDATAAQPVSTPVTASSPLPGSISDADLQCARSWIRALCNDSNDAVVGNPIRESLKQLADRDERSLDELLTRSVAKLVESKVISKVHGKGANQTYKLNVVYENRLKRLTYTEKFTQAVEFKAELDKSFRNNEEVVMPKNTNDGSIVAILNLQAHGRIRLDDNNCPRVPFGFEPGNYEGRKFPKHYYQWDIKILPTDKYVYNDDLPVLEQAKNFPIPDKGPLGEIPIWFDFHGNLDRARWVQYVCMMSFALSVKSPFDPETAVPLLSPCIEAFEAQLIMEWFDKLGLLEKATGTHGYTAGEWWWIIAGSLVESKEQDVIMEG